MLHLSCTTAGPQRRRAVRTAQLEIVDVKAHFSNSNRPTLPHLRSDKQKLRWHSGDQMAQSGEGQDGAESPVSRMQLYCATTLTCLQRCRAHLAKRHRPKYRPACQYAPCEPTPHLLLARPLHAPCVHILVAVTDDHPGRGIKTTMPMLMQLRKRRCRACIGKATRD